MIKTVVEIIMLNKIFFKNKFTICFNIKNKAKHKITNLLCTKENRETKANGYQFLKIENL